MKSTTKKLHDQAIQAINAIMSDTSCSLREKFDALVSVRKHLSFLIGGVRKTLEEEAADE